MGSVVYALKHRTAYRDCERAVHTMCEKSSCRIIFTEEMKSFKRTPSQSVQNAF
ncbi:MAG: hypothetical protein NC177_09505 [Ruminococcus flavefaciens]|nr:hypothetical protein [Ruminococcus flavefaciens]MCM1507351.1 hypothetical protein [Ruminococcus flavefaciens]MCM1507352.1 hypothetical protein [Ruminococcus flavefaciens]